MEINGTLKCLKCESHYFLNTTDDHYTFPLGTVDEFNDPIFRKVVNVCLPI